MCLRCAHHSVWGQIVFTFIDYNSSPTSPLSVAKESSAVEKYRALKLAWGTAHFHGHFALDTSDGWREKVCTPLFFAYIPFVHEAMVIVVSVWYPIKDFSMATCCGITMTPCELRHWLKARRSNSLGLPPSHAFKLFCVFMCEVIKCLLMFGVYVGWWANVCCSWCCWGFFPSPHFTPQGT